MTLIGRRDFIAGAITAWPLAARAQQLNLPVVGLVSLASADNPNRGLTAFRKGLSDTGHVEGRNVTVEDHLLDGQYDRERAVMADLVRRRVAVIVAMTGAIAAKAATATIPIVFATNGDPVKGGLVASLARPGGNLTGVNYFNGELAAKRLGLLHELVPKAFRIAALVNPTAVGNAESLLRDVQEATRTIGLQMRVLKASTSDEIDAAFTSLARERPDALFVGTSTFFSNQCVQFATLAARYGIPAAYPNRLFVDAGGLMSYGASLEEAFRQVGIYTGSILKGAKPADLPVVQSTKFEFVINVRTARALGIEVPPQLLAIADEVIE